MAIDYLDFELEIGPGQGREYPLAVLHSPVGEARATLHFPFDQLALERHSDKLRIALLRSAGGRRMAPTEDEIVVQEFGQALFDALFTGDVGRVYRLSLERAIQQGLGLRIKLRITPPELAALPWEFLYDRRQAEFVCLSARTPIVRYLECPQPIRPLAVQPPLRLLGMLANPKRMARLDVHSEKARLEQALAGLKRRNLVELVWLEGSTWHDLHRAMRGGPWHIFHFVGHGRYDVEENEGQLILCDQDGDGYSLGATELARLLADHGPLRLVVLNACGGAYGGQHDLFSGTAATLVRRGLPAVLAMQYAITDRAAIELAQNFYEALADGLPVDAAVVDARKAVSLALEGSLDWGAPVYFTRAPDGRVFNLGDTPAPGPPAPPVVDANLERQLERIYLDGLSAYHLEDWETARRCFVEMTGLHPGYQDAAEKLAQVERQIEIAGVYEQARQAMGGQDWRAARKALEALTAKAPGYKDVVTLLEQARKQEQLADLYAEARQLCQGGRWQAAITVFERIRALQPDYPDEEGLLACAERGLAAAEEPAGASAKSRYPIWAWVMVGLAILAVMVFGLGKLSDPLPGVIDETTAAPIALATTARPTGVLDTKAPSAVEPTKQNTPNPTTIPTDTTTLTPFPTPTPRPTTTPKGTPTTTLSPTPTLLPAQIVDALEVVMVLIPAGPFQMGAQIGNSYERPVHKVSLDAFYIDVYEVTNQLYARCAHERACAVPACAYYGQRQYVDHPVVCVDWSQAQAFCEWRGARLPTEAEWEKAARGGLVGALYPWGDEPPACTQGAENGAQFADCGGKTMPVGSFSPNGYGLYDMAGNVWEWVADWYSGTYYDLSPLDNPLGPPSGQFYVLRGGSWYDDKSSLRVANRNWDVPSDQFNYIGFRCARSP